MKRTIYLEQIKKQFKVHSVCAILGARQVGKTTLARQFAKEYQGKVEFFDLENPVHLTSLETPLLTLSQFPDTLIVIDEIQRRPDLFPILRVLVGKSYSAHWLIAYTGNKTDDNAIVPAIIIRCE